jgi:glycosyltransferase involved in cell wall biosynthesis
VLCFDEKSKETLDAKAIPNIRTISLCDIEESDPELRSIKGTRSLVEYYFTCTPCLPWYILNNNEEVNNITYLDSDIFFFSDPEEIYQTIGEYSIAITPHRLSKQHEEKIKWGIYNVGFNYFKKDNSGLECLNWWRKRCIEWCYDKIEDGKFADQGYLNDWPSRFKGVKVLDNPGVNLAPWNLQDCVLENKRGITIVDGEKLIFFHFHALKHIGGKIFKPCWENYSIKPGGVLLKKIYQKYIDTFYTLDNQTFENTKKDLNHPRDEYLAKNTPTEKTRILYQVFKNKILKAKRVLLEGPATDTKCRTPREIKKITLITPCFNAVKLLEPTIESIMQQEALKTGLCELEYIIIDGGSTDGTYELVAKYKNVRFISEKDSGMYDALSKGLKMATGDVVGYLNAGDRLFPWAFNILCKVFANRNVDWLTGYISIINGFGEVSACWPPTRYRKEFIQNGFYSSFKYPKWIQQESTFWSNRLNKSVDYERLKAFQYAGDYFLWTLFSKENDLHAVYSPLGAFLVHEGQLSEKREEYSREIRRIIRKPTLKEKFTAWWELHCNPLFKNRLWKHTLGKSSAYLFHFNSAQNEWIPR